MDKYDSALIKSQGLCQMLIPHYFSDNVNAGHSWCNSLSTTTVMHCLLLLSASGFCCTHTTHHTERLFFLAHMLPFYFHIGSGSKSALWGLKHWPWRAALATKTDGNPPANPSSSQPIITSLWPRVLLPKPPLPPSPRLSFALLERKMMLPPTLLPFQRFPTKSAPY